MKHLDLIDSLGGTNAVARLVGIRPSSVSGWKLAGTIPDDKLAKLAVIAEQRGITSRKDLRPLDYWLIWPDLKPPKKMKSAA